MNFFFFHSPVKNRQDEPGKNKLVAVRDNDQHFITEGGEFLDDALRMKEQPFILMRAEESIAPGCPDDLL